MRTMLLLLFTVISFSRSNAQTQPLPQPLPYQQNFDALPVTSTTYPDGWQGWTLSGSPSGNFNTAAPAGDKALATGSASSTTNGVYNYNGKLGFLNSGSADNALVLALNTSGQTNIQVQYDVMTLRNPYDGNSNTRINEVTLQYRVGNTGAFINITGTAYQNNTTTQTGSGITTPQQPVTGTTLLPADCENQPQVQLRWVNRQINGAGSRPGFAIDNITAGSSGPDTTHPAISELVPAAGAVGVAPATQPAITFTENITAGNGLLLLHNVSTGNVTTFNVDSPAVYISNRTLTLQTSLQPDQTYFITLDSAAVLDLSGNAFAGIPDSTVWRFSTGAQQLNFDFNICTTSSGNLSGGFRQYSISGAQFWDCTTFGQDNTNGVQINGYSNGPVENEDWLISPSFDLTGFDYPLLRFASRTAFAGPALQLLVSTDYNGSGDPHTATWKTINGRFPGVSSDAWKTTDSINLSAFKQENVHVAFVYRASPAAGAARWTIDDLLISNSTVAPPPAINSSVAGLDFDYVKAGQLSAPQSFTFWADDLNNSLSVTAPAGFQIAKDSGAAYGYLLTYSPETLAEGPQTVWVRFAPTAADQAYNSTLTFTATGLNTVSVPLSGTSLRSLKVVNWNIEWFGSPVQNPANDSLQQANVTTILQKLDADVFALAEVVDTQRLKNIVSQLPGYSYVISDFGSYADNVADPDYVSAQKLAFVYKTAVIRNLGTYGVLRQGGSGNAYYNWSSGRFPFMMEARARLDTDSALVRFVLIHAKANTGTAAEKINSWQRRKNGAKELKDSLDAQYPNSNLVVLGDFNDAFDKTITTELAPDTTTSYIDFINDSLHYKPLTLPLSLAGKKSTASYNTVIDNVLASGNMAVSYLPGSARIITGVEQLVNNYSSTTTDHYPVQTSYNLQVLANPIPVNGFTAREDAGKVKATWNTRYEINAGYFVVERSRNQRSFEPVDSIPASGNSSSPNSYISYDERPWLGFSWYRLKSVSLDSTVQYSPAQRVLVTGKDLWFKLLWCILGRHLQVWLDMDRNGPASLQLIDVQGNVRYQGQMPVVKGRNLKTLDISNLPAGIYFLRVQSGDQSQVSKIFVSH